MSGAIDHIAASVNFAPGSRLEHFCLAALGLLAEHRTPLCPQTPEVEIAQARDLDLYGIMINQRLSHARQAAQRVDFRLAGLGAAGGTIR